MKKSKEKDNNKLINKELSSNTLLKSNNSNFYEKHYLLNELYNL